MARTYYWTPFDIEKLFVDDLDKYGLLFWYNDAKEIEKSFNKK